ncbi:hypothetical protein Glove_219g17 [Diversispora epigaea]|uniref:Uncharacterized protein n=1 Tax=Diversispora epigaea TaxID=1348612 RepID=A0A397IGA7_9GLOM|nr:hypothetical protein Glove_219g17 [Diversispora epigaea]
MREVIKAEKIDLENQRYLIDELKKELESKKNLIKLQGAQHRLHNTSWYKDVKELEDIVNRNQKRRYISQDNGIFLLEVHMYDEKPEIVIPQRIQKIKEFNN